MNKKKTRTSILAVFICVIGILVVMISMGVHVVFQTHKHGKIISTKHILSELRTNVQWYHRQTGQWPSSIPEIYEYVIEENISYDGEVGIDKFGDELIVIYKPSFFAEDLSINGNNANIYNSLNGEGGFYYNNQTGEVRINLTKPVKHYFKKYIGEERDEIPADW